MDYSMIGKRVSECRKNRKISQEQLAERIEVSTTYIGAIETAHKTPSLQTLVKLANALGTTADILLYGNLWHLPAQYDAEVSELLQSCSPSERRIIFLTVKTLKIALLERRG